MTKVVEFNVESGQLVEREMSVEEQTQRDAEITAWEAGAYDREYALVQEQRRQAYIREADPLFFGWQRGENTEQDWLDAVQAVKDAHPYPEQPTA